MEHGSIASRRPHSNPRLRLLCALIAVFATTACAGRMAQPNDQQDLERILAEYREQLAEEGLTPTTAAATIRSGPSTSSTPVPLPAAASADGSIRGPLPPQDSYDSWKMVNGIPEYRIGRADLLVVTAYVGPETGEQRLRVQADGTIFISRFDIGRVQAEGLSPTELSDRLIGVYQPFAPGAYVDVEVEEHRAWRATLLGELLVRAQADTGPGTYPLEGRTTVGEFIFSHGGVTDGADLSDVRIIRDGQEFSVDLARAGALAQDSGQIVDAGDVVFVPSREVGTSRIYVLGEVRQPGVISYNENTTLLDALSRAGGYTAEASLEDTLVTRAGGGQARVIAVDLSRLVETGRLDDDVPLQPGDFIIIPRRSPPFLQRAQAVLTILNIVATVAIIATR